MIVLDQQQVRSQMGPGLPPIVGAGVHLHSGSGSFKAGRRSLLDSGERGGDSAWETEDYATAENRL